MIVRYVVSVVFLFLALVAAGTFAAGQAALSLLILLLAGVVIWLYGIYVERS